MIQKLISYRIDLNPKKLDNITKIEKIVTTHG
jgi:hypothetical protein